MGKGIMALDHFAYESLVWKSIEAKVISACPITLERQTVRLLVARSHANSVATSLSTKLLRLQLTRNPPTMQRWMMTGLVHIIISITSLVR